jgi:hypothetical protein
MFPNYFIFNDNSLIMQLKRLTSRGTISQNTNNPTPDINEQTKTPFLNMNVEDLLSMNEPLNFNLDLNHKDEHNFEMYKTFSDFSLAAHHIMEEINRKETPSNTTDKFTLNSIASFEPRVQFKQDTSFFIGDRGIENLFLTRNPSFGFKNNTIENINPLTFLDNKTSEMRSLFSDSSQTLTSKSIFKKIKDEKDNSQDDMINESRLCLTRLGKECKKLRYKDVPTSPVVIY